MRFRMLLDNDKVPVFQLDQFCVIDDCNSNACEFSGLKKKDMLGRHLYDYIQSDCKLSEIITGEQNYSVGRFYHDSGKVSSVIIMIDNVFREEKHIYFLSVFDVSMDESAENRTRSDNTKLLVGHIAHAFNNILTEILGSLSTLREEADIPEQYELMLQNAENGAVRARHLTDGMLAFSRGEITPVPSMVKSHLAEHNRLFLSDASDSGRLLFLDDNPFVADTAIGMLCTLGYCVDMVSEEKAALDKYRKAMNSGNPYRVVIMNLPAVEGMDGTEAVKAFLEMDPAAVVILSSGFAGSDIMMNYSSFGFKAALTKPYTVRELFVSLKTALGE